MDQFEDTKDKEFCQFSSHYKILQKLLLNLEKETYKRIMETNIKNTKERNKIVSKEFERVH